MSLKIEPTSDWEDNEPATVWGTRMQEELEAAQELEYMNDLKAEWYEANY